MEEIFVTICQMGPIKLDDLVLCYTAWKPHERNIINSIHKKSNHTDLYSFPEKHTILRLGSPSPGCDVSTHAQLISLCTHSLFLSAREPGCAISLAARHLELRFANKHATCQEIIRWQDEVYTLFITKLAVPFKLHIAHRAHLLLQPCVTHIYRALRVYLNSS